MAKLRRNAPKEVIKWARQRWRDSVDLLGGETSFKGVSAAKEKSMESFGIFEEDE